MEWSDQAIVLSSRRHGENGAILSVLSAMHGRHAGLVRGGGGRRGNSLLQPGNLLNVTWKARLAEQLGVFSWEPIQSFSALWLDDSKRLAAIASMASLADAVLLEREPCVASWQAFLAFLSGLDQDDWLVRYVTWEMTLLDDLGFGLDLSCCAASGTTEDLIYVSPKSGCAVSRKEGAPYHDRLLPLPAFLLHKGAADVGEILAGLRLTSYFLERHVLEGGKMAPPARTRFITRLEA